MTEYPHIILPDNGTALLRQELALAFDGEGCRVSRVPPEVLSDPARAPELEELMDQGPALLFSVNCMGLSRVRPLLEAARRHRGDIAAWFVDNPWNILSGVRDPGWKELLLFVTDESFIPHLRAMGAGRVFHLPLAASPDIFAGRQHRQEQAEPLAPFVFVGRSAFPGKDLFFAGQAVPEALAAQAEAMLDAGRRPDLHWWEERLGRKPEEFWPGKKARGPALGAEDANFFWRGTCLREAALAGAAISGNGAGLDIFGDAGWQPTLPAAARLHAPVDYYTRLAPLYAAARYSLCLTSLQLPMGLNQRHFDIWMAGGFCLTDATPGLSLFPEELVRPIRFQKAQDIPRLVNGLEGGAFRRTLRTQWQDLLREKHTYAHRVRAVLRRASGDAAPD